MVSQGSLSQSRPALARILLAIAFVFIALLGGFESVPGPLIGAIAFEFIRTYASKYFPNEWQLVLGAIMLAIILFRPGGIWAIYQSLRARLGRREPGLEHA